MRFAFTVVAAATALLGGCAAPPPAAVPAAPLPAAFRAAAAPAPVPAVGAAWWRVFDDPALDALVTEAQAANPSLEIAAARLAAARAQARAAGASRRPQADLNAGASRQGGPLLNDAGSSGTLLTTGVSVAWEIDLFGRLAQAAEAAALDADQQAALHAAATLALQADVAQAWFALRAAEAERRLGEASLEALREGLDIATRRVASGSLAAVELARWQADVAAAGADLQALARRRAEAEHTLALLLGRAPADFAAAPPAAALPGAPVVPAGLPSEVLARRADVAAAAHALAAAEARAGEARSAWWPRLVLTAAGGQASGELGTLLQSSARAWGLGLVAALPLLDGGRREAGVAKADAEVQAARAAHRQQVLRALKDVEDQLVALTTLQAEAALRGEAEAAAQRATTLARQRLEAGLASRADLLRAQRHEAEHRRRALHVQAQQLQAGVALVRALGGGWGDGRDRAAQASRAPS